MTSKRLTVGVRFKWKGVRYEIRRVLPENKLNIEDLYTGAVTVVTMMELVEALFMGDLLIELTRDDGLKKPLSLAVDDYPEGLIVFARSCLEIIQPVLDVPFEKRTREIVAAVAEKSGVDVSTIYRWIKAYESSGNDIRALVPAYESRGGKGESRIHSVLDDIIDAVIREKYLVPERTTVKDVQYEIHVRVAEENLVRAEGKKLAVPSRRTIYRRVEAFGVSERFSARNGKAAAAREMSQYAQSDRPLHLFERVEFDNTRADFIVVDDEDDLPLGRLNLTTGLCVASGYPGGYYMGFEPPSIYSLMECFFHLICPKGDVQAKYGTEHPWLACGVPFGVAVDNGKDFVSNAFQDACAVLGTHYMRMPVKTPWYKGSVERFFKTLDTGLFHIVAGSTFSNPTARGDYKSMEEACIYLSQVDKLLHIFLLDVYAEEFHKGLNGVPARLWENGAGATFSPRLPQSVSELRILLGRSEMRIIQHYGVELENLRYNHPDLARLRALMKGEAVKVRYHPGDLSRVDVLDPFENVYISAPALAVEYTKGLSLWKHMVILKHIRTLGEEVNIESLGRAKRKIQEIVDEGRNRRRVATRSREARWSTAGYATRDLDKLPVVMPPPNPAAPLSVQDMEAKLLGLDRGAGWRVETSGEEATDNAD
jgi:putative transposase